MKRHLTLTLLSALTFSVAFAQDASQLTLERIITNGEFGPDWFGQSRWIDGGAGYTTLETSASHPQFTDIVRYETSSGNKEIIVAAASIIPNGANDPLTIEKYEWSSDKSKLLIYTNSKRVWRENTKGDYWVLHLASGKLQKLGGASANPSTLMFAKFSPDGGRVAYVRAHNIYVEQLVDSKIVALTTDGNREMINGTFDWVYEEEFGCQDGFRWSPDGSKIAYWQLDANGLGVFNMINNTDSIYSKIIPIQYPKVGEANSACRIGVVNASGGETTWMKVAGDPRNNYLPRMQWAANSKDIVMQHANRRQDHYQIMTADAATGEVSVIYEDKDNAWIEAVDDWKYLDKGKNFTWVSEKNGWKSVYKVKRDGSKEELISSGTFDVVNISLIDDEGGYLYYRASPDNAAQRYLYRSSLSGKKPQRLTPNNWAGSNNYNISPNAKWAIHTYSKAGVPTTTSLISLPDHKVVRVLVDNAELKAKVDKLDKNEMEFFSVNAQDGTSLDCYMIKPPGFDPNKKYPVFFYVYGEPWGQTVQDSWGGGTYLYHLYLAQNGYIVMSVDNRGTPGPKGREWRKSVHGQIGVQSSADQADAARAIVAKYDFVDPDRIGIWGWSGGGSMTLNMMFRYPEIYKTGVSVAPVPDQTLYDNVYQERYSGLITEKPESYKQGSPITHAKNLQGNLMVIHGTGDDNVHYQGTERLINELVKHNKIFSLMSYPNRSHGIWEGEGTSRHLYETMFRYISTNLEPGGKAKNIELKK
jgi:dipeptidyl-peptidase-4